MKVDGKKIREQRLRLAFTQSEFADEIGVSLRTVQTWESGETAIRLLHLRRLSRLTQRPIEFFKVET
jgi:DNA-binding transcriptional regulator YiaG